MACLHGTPCLRTQWVDHGDEPEKGESPQVVVTEGRRVRQVHVTCRHGEHPVTGRGERERSPLGPLRIQALDLVVDRRLPGAHRRHSLGSALDHHAKHVVGRAACGVLIGGVGTHVHARGVPALRLERQLPDRLPARLQVGVDQPQLVCQHQHRDIDGIAGVDPTAIVMGQRGLRAQRGRVGQPLGLVELADVLLARQEQPALRHGAHAADRDRLADGHGDLGDGQLVHGQRAGLVRRDQRAGPKALDGDETTDDDIALGHPVHPDRQRHGQSDRQPLRDRRDRQRDGSQRHLVHSGATREADRRCQQRHDPDHGSHRQRELSHPAQQRRLGKARLPHRAAKAPQLRVAAGGDDDAPPPPADGQRARVGHGDPLGEHDLVGHRRLGVLGHGDRLAGECGLVDLQPAGVQQPHVRGHPVTRGEQHDVAGHDLAGGHVVHVAVPDHAGTCRHHVPQRLGASGCLMLLHRTNHRVDHQHGGDEGRLGPLAQIGRQRSRDDQDVDQRAGELADDVAQETR